MRMRRTAFRAMLQLMPRATLQLTFHTMLGLLAEPCGGQRVEVIVGQKCAMIHACRAQFACDACPRARSELRAVHADAEAALPGGSQHRAGFVAVESVGGMRLAENIRPAGVAFTHYRVQHRPAYQAHVVVAVAEVRRGAAGAGIMSSLRRPVFLGNRMPAEESNLGRESGGHAQQFGFVRHVETVAAFDLHRGGALRPGFAQQCKRTVCQHVFAGRAGGVHRAQDAAAVILLAAHARLELIATVAAEDQMRMRVHETGQQRPTGEVDAARLGCGSFAGFVDCVGLGGFGSFAGSVAEFRHCVMSARIPIFRGQITLAQPTR